ncbi:EF-Hand 1, calcium-binding site [Phytophthora cactorum]|nr:EF-Hand 1, calcium-binding site [Phytophthora cactorum]
MGGVKLALLGAFVNMTAVQAIPGWGDIGAAHGAPAVPVPVSFSQLPGQFGRRDTETDPGKWRSLAQNEDTDDKLRLRSRKVPPFDVLDANHDNSISQDEWTAYVTKLLSKAVGVINKGIDTTAKGYLLDIVKFHYDNLNDCILAELLEVFTIRVHSSNQILWLSQLSSTDFAEITTELEHRCYVKFRYSLFAGPPPFELVSNSAPTVQAHEVETWFSAQLDIARHDMQEHRVYKMTDNDQLRLEQLVACAHEKLGPWCFSCYVGETELNRDHFYDALTEIVRCA